MVPSGSRGPEAVSRGRCAGGRVIVRPGPGGHDMPPGRFPRASVPGSFRSGVWKCPCFGCMLSEPISIPLAGRLEVPDGPDTKRAADAGPRPGRCRGLGCVRGPRRVAADGRSPTPGTRPGRHPRRRAGGLRPVGDVWRYDGRSFARDTRRGDVRPLADLPPSLEAACRALRAGPGIETIRALAFPVQPQQKVGPAGPAGTGNARRPRPGEAGTGPAAARAGRSSPEPVWPAQPVRLSGLHASISLFDGYGAAPWYPTRPGFTPSCGP
jgi:hypothetical protein